MFERRLKIFLSILVLVTLVLAARAMQVQVVDAGYWTERATKVMQRTQLIETTRGRILDFRGREMAVDSACIDACVDYRSIVRNPDPAWIRTQAIKRLTARMGSGYRRSGRDEQKKLLADESAAVRADIESMWATLAEVSGQTLEQIEEVRSAIIQRVEMRRRYVWYRNFQIAKKRHENQEPPPGWQAWLIDPAKDAPQLDEFDITVAEQKEPHVILRAVTTDVNNYLGKNIEKYPGLVLRPSTHRLYPYGEAGCHLLGHLARVTREDLQKDPNLGGDELKQYYPNDLIGRAGLESLGEPVLRGTRGQIDRMGEKLRIVGTTPAKPGGDVHSTIDIELQRELQLLFRNAKIKRGDGTIEQHEMHGAAVVIDVPTNQVRALVSYPTFDLNQLDDLYGILAADEINRPLFNRATQSQLEPGSTVKPIVGLGAITQGEYTAASTIECTGFLVLRGQRWGSVGRCWVAKRFLKELGEKGVAHHQIPYEAPHPTGFLTFSDALERSCNVYFETVADRLGIEGLSYWYDRFGLGRPTGIGIAEASGRLPSSYRGSDRRMTAWFAGIGQGQVAATPIQMANVAATIARDGLWMRPRLIVDEPGLGKGDASPASPETRDLQLSPDAVAAAKAGMWKVVNTRAGSGFEHLHRDDVSIAGKSGSAQAAKFSIPLRDEHGQVVRGDNGKPLRKFLEPSTDARPNPANPWYRGHGEDGSDLTHAWFIGYAPADKPQIAFAVLVEYGGAGGAAAAPIARDILEACVEHGYLARRKF